MLRAVLIDLSGTLHIENDVIPGAIEALNRLRQTNLYIKFVSNTTKESKRLLHERLTKLGYSLEPNEISTSLSTTRDVVVQRNLKPLLLLSPEAKEEFEGHTLKDDEKPNAVVVGLAPTEFHYNKLNEAFRCLLNGGKLIATHVGKYYAQKDGLALGPGCFVKGLEYSAQCQAEVVGKPTPAFFKAALGDIPPETAIMIGDDIINDIKGASAVGMQTCLLRTGKYRSGDEKRIKPGPTLFCKCFSEAVDDVVDDVQGAQSAGLQGILVQTGKYRKLDEQKINPPPFAVCSSFVEAVETILDLLKVAQEEKTT